MKDKPSIMSQFFLFSGQLLINFSPHNWKAPDGTMINGNLMFEEAFLTQVYWLAKTGLIALVPEEKSVLSKKVIHIQIKKLNKTTKSNSPIVKLFLESLPENKIELADWVKIIGRRAGRSNPALDILAIAESEVENLKTEKENKFLFFTFKSKVWDQEKIKQLADQNLKTIKELWEKGKQQSWWEPARKRLKAGLTLLRLHRWEPDSYETS